jgi:hypothetical protein
MRAISLFTLICIAVLQCLAPGLTAAQTSLESKDFADALPPASLSTPLRPRLLAEWTPGPAALPAGWPGSTRAPEDRPGLLFLATGAVPLSNHPRQGAWRTIPATITQGWQGRAVRVTVQARKMPNAGSDRFAVAVASPLGDSSGWRLFNATHAEQSFSFTWLVPHDAGAGAFTLGIWADAEGGGRGVILSALTLDVVGPRRPPPLMPADGRIILPPGQTPVPSPAPIIATPIPLAPPPPTPAPRRPAPVVKQAPSLPWGAHIASYADEPAATAGWAEIGQKFPALTDYKPLLVRQRLQTGQTMVRLLAGPFADERAVRTFCTEAMDGWSYCEPVRR